jgi:mannose-6-phosphate isomerase-like protein (cupin superfamily)
MSHRARSTADTFDFYGLTICELTPDAMTRASVAEILVPSGAAHPQARSVKSDKLYVGLSGTVDFDLEDGGVRLAAGDTLAIACGRWFAYANHTDEDARLLLVHVPPFDLDAEEFAPDAGPPA